MEIVYDWETCSDCRIQFFPKSEGLHSYALVSSCGTVLQQSKQGVLLLSLLDKQQLVVATEDGDQRAKLPGVREVVFIVFRERLLALRDEVVPVAGEEHDQGLQEGLIFVGH